MNLRAPLFKLSRKESQTKKQLIRFPIALLLYTSDVFLTAVTVALWLSYVMYTKCAKRRPATGGLILRLPKCIL